MNQKFSKSFIFYLILSTASLIYLCGCSNEEVPSLYDESSPGSTGATPQINSVEPPSTAIAAVTPITITGSNFLSDTSLVNVYFGDQAAKVIAASSTQLTVISPNISGSLKIKISTSVSVPFSNTYEYVLQPAAVDFYPDSKDETNKPFSIIIDKIENIYSSNSGLGVVKITPDSVSTLYSVRSGETYFTHMRFGPGGELFAARGLQAVFTIPDGGGVKNSPWVVLSPNTIKISQIEFDPMGNLWAAGNNAEIYRLKPDKNYSAFPFDYNVTAMRTFIDNGNLYLYLAANQNTNTTIMRIPIDTNGDLGSPQTFFDFSANYGSGFAVNDLTFAADGEMFLATDLPSPIVYVKPDKSTGLLYNGILLNSPALSLAWGNENFLYYVREQINDANDLMLIPQTIVKLNLLKPGAPYYD